MESKRLNRRQVRFCEAYAISLNATKAAIEAGYSEGTAYSIGNNLLKKVEIQNFLMDLEAKIAERNRVTADYLIEEFRTIINDDIKNYIDFKKSRKGIRATIKQNIAELNTRNIQQLQVNTDGSFKIKLYGRDNALIQLGRHTGFFNDQLTIKNNLEEILREMTDKNKLSETQLKKLAEYILELQKRNS